MPDNAVIEEPFFFGEGGRLFGILTSPATSSPDAKGLPVFVFLSAGVLPRGGPYRLHVRLARELSKMGFSALRVDLAGRGDSAARPGLANQQSVAADYAEIKRLLELRLGTAPIVLGGLCAGADNSIRLAVTDPQIVGLVLLDPICYPDEGFRARALWVKYSSPARYVAWLKRRFKTLTNRAAGSSEKIDPLTLRDLPTLEQLQAAFESIRKRRGRVLSVFTQYAHIQYCNRPGQLGRVVGIEGYDQFCTELFWREAGHTYMLERHRSSLIDEITAWATAYIH